MFLYKWGAKVLFTYATSDRQLSWIYLKLRESVLVGISAVAWESSTTGASQRPSVTTVSVRVWDIFPDGVLGLHVCRAQADVNGTIMISPSLAASAAVSLIPWTAGKV